MNQAQQRAFEDFKARLEPDLALMSHFDQAMFLVRLERYFGDLYAPFQRLYADHVYADEVWSSLARQLVKAWIDRDPDLRVLDYEREITPDWFQQSQMVGGIYYVDLFAGNLQGVREHLDYLKELGLTYIHLMPLLKPRAGANDGGYAVQDYRAVNPTLGTIADLRAVARDFHANGMSLCIDVVVNHTAKEHAWAQKAVAGEQRYLEYYLTYADQTLPEQYERTLPEVFPDFAPGNFTWYPTMAGSGRWVWTTFNEYQWDLDYTNPRVWQEMLDILLFLANLGVDVLRLDAVPFMWKRMGTNCQNQPEVLDLVQALRAALRIVSPATICKAEAIVAPDDLVQYLGMGERTGKLCDIAYHNSLMVLLWSALATRRADLWTQSLLNMPPTPSQSAWITYVRCHDDIGWAITDENAELVHENGFKHREFLSLWYSGEFPMTWARGAVFQFNPITQDRRISGMTASLAGLEFGLSEQNPRLIDLAIKRIVLLYSIIFAYGGIPLIYMGDELGMLNDQAYLHDPAKAADNRWLHRPAMDWQLAEQRHNATSIAGRIWSEMRQLIETRKNTPALHSAAITTPFWTDNKHVIGFARKHERGQMVVLANFSDSIQHVAEDCLWRAGLRGNIRDLLSNQPVILHDRIVLQGYQCVWLVGS